MYFFTIGGLVTSVDAAVAVEGAENAGAAMMATAAMMPATPSATRLMVRMRMASEYTPRTAGGPPRARRWA